MDTPGLHAGGGKLGEFMQQTARRAVEDVDVLCLVVDATERTGPDDAGARAAARVSAAPRVCVLNKTDAVAPKAGLAPAASIAGAPPTTSRGAGADLGASTAPTATGSSSSDRRRCPSTRRFFPADATSDQPETFYVAEVIREQIFHLTHQEVPYATAVRVEELTERDRAGALYIRATIFVEQESQKGIVDRQGRRHAASGSAPRPGASSRRSSGIPGVPRVDRVQVRQQLAQGRARRCASSASG